MSAAPQIPLAFHNPKNAPTYVEALDGKRLHLQRERVLQVMQDGTWRTLGDIEDVTGYPQASISARLRDLRKARYGGHTVLRKRLKPAERGLWSYRVLPAGGVE